MRAFPELPFPTVSERVPRSQQSRSAAFPRIPCKGSGNGNG